jgi:glycosyltransferase involved in cell wall biosynthesis
MKRPLVSISCITYNQVNYIKDCIEGFLMQKVNFDYEIIIHDDASTDGTKDIIEDYIERFPSLIYPIFRDNNQYSQGVRHIMARFNFPRCRGKYIAWCDGDDYWTDPHKLQKQVDFLEANPDFTICFHNVIMKNMTEESERIYPEYQNNTILDFDDLIKGNFIPSLSCVFRNHTPTFPKWILDLNAGDWALLLFNANLGKIYYIAETMATYRIHTQSIWSSLSYEKQQKKDIEDLTKISHIYPKYHDDIKATIQQRQENLKAWKIKQNKIKISTILDKIKKPFRPIKKFLFGK